ncbi:PKD domain-containing protein, partial [bacterium]|nr:PKD domain-containing protein [bacterium]
LSVINTIQGGVTNCGVLISVDGHGNVVSNCLLVSVHCQGASNTFAYNGILGGCSVYGSHNTLRRNRISCSWSGSVQVLGYRHVFDGNVVYSNQYGFFVSLGGYHTFVRNRIGCDETGLTPLPIWSSGFWLDRTTGNQIGGDRDTEANVIVACSNNAAIIDSMGVSNRIEGNLIGVGANGVTPMPNAAGLNIQSTSNSVIGSPGRGNIIGACRYGAISASGTGLQIVANRIGTDVHGVLDRANGSGVIVSYAPDAVIAGNTICGAREGYGLLLDHADGVHIWGNHIGADLPGTAALPNAAGGIKVHESQYVTIGGPYGYNLNVIAGNTSTTADDGQGILIAGGWEECQGTRVINNYIGVDATGTNPLGNASAGVHVQHTGGVTIGGTNAGPQNIIRGNGGPGVLIESEVTDYPATNNMVLGNSITDNRSHGVALLNKGSSNNVIALNLITGNASNGVNIAAGMCNLIASNAIHGNALMGINLGAQGRNDGPESTTSANRYQRYPLISNVVAVAGGTRVRGSFASAVSRTYRIEFFASPAASPAGFGEGRVLAGVTNLTTGADGATGFDIAFPVTVTPGWILTATATDPDGNTSEFSEQTTVEGVMAGFSAGRTLVVTGQMVQFTDASLGPPTAWYWDFDGNGTVDSTAQNPAHAYATPGDKTVKLVASNAYGASTAVKHSLIRVAGAAHVAAPGDDVQAIINASQPFDTIALSAGVYRASAAGQSVLVLSQPVTLAGIGAPGAVVIDGEGARRCLHVVSGRVENVTCINGAATNAVGARNGSGDGGVGGGALLENGELDRCIVRDCRASVGGGVCAFGDGWIRSTLIISNTAGSGGGLALHNDASAYNLTIADNAAMVNAGGVMLYGGTLWNSIAWRNTAPTNANWQVAGGAVFFSCTKPRPAGWDSTDADPGLQADYTITPASPCADAGCEFAWMSSAQDLPGEARVQGGGVDMGAFEAVPEPCAALLLDAICLVVAFRRRARSCMHG